MYKQTFTNNLNIKASDYAFYPTDSSKYLNVLVDVPQEFRNNISKFQIEIAVMINAIDYVGWFQGAFAFEQSLFLGFVKRGSLIGLEGRQLDNSSSNVIDFNNNLNQKVCFNPFTPEERPQTNNPNFPYLTASYSARVDLSNEIFINNFFQGRVSLNELLDGQLIVDVVGFADNFTSIDNSSVTSLDFVNMQYTISVFVEALKPSI